MLELYNKKIFFIRSVYIYSGTVITKSTAPYLDKQRRGFGTPVNTKDRSLIKSLDNASLNGGKKLQVIAGGHFIGTSLNQDIYLSPQSGMLSFPYEQYEEGIVRIPKRVAPTLLNFYNKDLIMPFKVHKGLFA